MLRPTVFSPIAYFYPLGNTPAVCLTQDLPPEQDANILLLGCGDARNILYTLHADARLDQRSFDITCCDIEPAILARNILLFTLVIDDTKDVNIREIWNIYYHLYLDECSLQLLDNQARKLQAASVTLDSWNGSEYGKCLRFCDKRTFSIVKSEWAGYTVHDLSAREKTIRSKRFEDAIQRAKTLRTAYFGKGGIMTGFRSAAPLGFQAMKDLPKLHQHFWDHGVTHEEEGQIASVKCPNPTFTSSVSDSVTLHYGTDPYLGFHLATAYAPVTSNSPLRPEGGNCSRLTMVSRAAQLQFRSWIDSFKRRTGRGVTIRFFTGDALAFSRALKCVGTDKANISSNLYCDPWTMQPLTLDGGDYTEPEHLAPTKFDVVDTSNLVDHLGALNILIVTASLLAEKASSTLYAEVLVQHEAGVETMIDNLLSGHYSTISVILGLAPIEAWANATSVGSIDEGLLNSILPVAKEEARQNRTRLRWKKSALSHRKNCHAIADRRLQLEAMELSSLLYEVYLKMFRQEDITNMRSNLNIHSVQKLSNPYYYRSSFCALLDYLTAIIEVDWKKVLDRLLGLIEQNSSLAIGQNYLQELYLYLHLLGLYTVSPLRPNFSIFYDNLAAKTLSSWRTVPPVVCITFTVPRQRLAPLQEKPPSQLGTPSMCCTLQSSELAPKGAWSNTFAVLQLAFGELLTNSQEGSDDFRLSVKEDPTKWTGKSPLVVSFLVPTWIVLQEPQAAVVAFGLQHTPYAAVSFGRQLGPYLRLFETTLRNEGVHITKFMPNLKAHPLMMSGSHTVRHGERSPLTETAFQTSISASIDRTGTQIFSLTCRIHFLAEETKLELHDKCSSVDISQTSPTVIDVIVGRKGVRYEAIFPAPVLGSRTKTRIARKSAYIELAAPIIGPLGMNKIPSSMFPMSIARVDTAGQLPLNLNLPRVGLDDLPVLDVGQTSKLKWLVTHLSLMFSSRESKLRDFSMSGGAHEDIRVDFKDGLLSLFMHFSGVQGQKARIFALHKANEGGVPVLIFVSAMKLELASHTVVLDAAVLPLTMRLIQRPSMQVMLADLQNEQMGQINVTADELRLWKMNIPGYAERCRTWKHCEDRCEYITAGKIPIPSGLEDGCTPLCSCGNGQLPPKFITNPKIRNLDSILQKHATRVAIAPCFAVPYVEECFKRDKSEVAQSSNTAGIPAACLPEKRGLCNVCGADKATSADGKSGALLTCGRCHNARYCSASCQKVDWKEHKKTCTLTEEMSPSFLV